MKKELRTINPARNQLKLNKTSLEHQISLKISILNPRNQICPCKMTTRSTHQLRASLNNS